MSGRVHLVTGLSTRILPEATHAEPYQVGVVVFCFVLVLFCFVFSGVDVVEMETVVAVRRRLDQRQWY